ncbi:MAG TPA: prepilin-type N-terminal cleavage/methylation domain-containing protein [Geminicoccaceae bacterium]
MSSAPGERGFTLLELLVAITLLGLLMAGLLGSLRLGARAWETGAGRLEASARLITIQGFLRDRLTHAIPLFLPDPAGRESLAFTGGPETMTLLTTLPDQLGAGLHVVTLGVREDDEGVSHLGFAWRPLNLDPDGVPLPTMEAGRRDLIRDIAGLELGYFGARGRDPEPAWHEAWEDEQVLPTLIRLRVVLGEEDPRRIPELVVRPMIDLAPAF